MSDIKVEVGLRVKNMILRKLLQGDKVDGFHLLEDTLIDKRNNFFYRSMVFSYDDNYYQIDYDWSDNHHSLFSKEEVTAKKVKVDFKFRIITECKDLIEKSDKLHAFLSTKKFYKLDRSHKDLLYKQFRLMNEYIQVLGQRMELLGIDKFK